MYIKNGTFLTKILKNLGEQNMQNTEAFQITFTWNVNIVLFDDRLDNGSGLLHFTIETVKPF